MDSSSFTVSYRDGTLARVEAHFFEEDENYVRFYETVSIGTGAQHVKVFVTPREVVQSVASRDERGEDA